MKKLCSHVKTINSEDSPSGSVLTDPFRKKKSFEKSWQGYLESSRRGVLTSPSILHWTFILTGRWRRVCEVLPCSWVSMVGKSRHHIFWVTYFWCCKVPPILHVTPVLVEPLCWKVPGQSSPMSRRCLPGGIWDPAALAHEFYVPPEIETS